MKAQDYISSGLLEAYVLGSLSEAESEQVAGAICRFPEVAAEVQSLEAMLLDSEKSQAPALPVELKDKIWAAIQSAPVEQVSGAEVRQAELPKTVNFPAAKNERNLAWAALWIGLLLSVGGNLYQQMDSRQTSLRASQLAVRVDSMNQRQNEMIASMERYHRESEMAARPDMEMVPMKSIVAGHAMAATFYLDRNSREAYVAVQKLPPTPEGMQYQVWAIQDGKPQSIGLLDHAVADNNGLQKLTAPVEFGQAFAISLEKMGGSEQPTPDRIYVLGKRPV